MFTVYFHSPDLTRTPPLHVSSSLKHNIKHNKSITYLKRLELKIMSSESQNQLIPDDMGYIYIYFFLKLQLLRLELEQLIKWSSTSNCLIL